MDEIIFEIKMINMCGESWVLTLKIKFSTALNDAVFPDDFLVFHKNQSLERSFS